MNINITVTFTPQALAEALTLLRRINTRTIIMANDLTGLQTVVDSLEAKAAETNSTLAGLAQAIVDLKGVVDIQPAIDALTAKAVAILDGLSAAEDAADDQLPAP